MAEITPVASGAEPPRSNGQRVGRRATANQDLRCGDAVPVQPLLQDWADYLGRAPRAAMSSALDDMA